MMILYYFLVIVFLRSVYAEIPSLSQTWTGNCDEHTNATNEVERQVRKYLTSDAVRSDLNNRFGPPQPSCDGPGWTLIANLNMNDISQTCPEAWQLKTSGIFRGCGNTRPEFCNSVFFHAGFQYLHVCGRITAVQFGGPDAFFTHLNNHLGLEEDYLDGVSLTHGSAGSRNHIWSFTIAASESTNAKSSCACIDSSRPWPFTIPSFIGDNYYCDTGNPTPAAAKNQYYTDNPVWDGIGCSAISTCCSLNNPPWFSTKLSVPTSDPVEARLCTNARLTSEDVVVTRIEIYVK